jgi:hypothetical protein
MNLEEKEVEKLHHKADKLRKELAYFSEEILEEMRLRIHFTVGTGGDLDDILRVFSDDLREYDELMSKRFESIK